jgi:DNA-nicking Smr family endonuclease
MTAPKKPTDDDIDLFRRSVGPVSRTSHNRIGPASQARPPRPRVRQEECEHSMADAFSDHFDAGEVSGEEQLFFARPGLQQRQLQRLRRGQLTIGAELDLHGMTASMARGAIMEFISLCRDRHTRCARIIHGKGYGSTGDAPVLKNRMNTWLRQHHDVMAFCSATKRDGGAGALYVLLRAQRG